LKKKYTLRQLLCLLLILLILPVSALAVTPASQAGERKLEGGQRDFLWPLPGNYNLTSCFLDNRAHYSLDIDGEMGDPVIASYAGKVIGISTGNASTGWGNYVLLEHNYTKKGGDTVTLYSRYAHLKDVLVAEGDNVAAGEKIGTVGATGSVNTSAGDGSHLDYDILCGGTSPSSTYSMDPFVNELLELPDGIYTTSGKCCQDYIAYIKQLYPSCQHEQFDAQGECIDCGYEYNWKNTWDCGAMGNYSVSASVQLADIPYTPVQSGGTELTAGGTVSVTATVVNGNGETWYEVKQGESLGYAPKNKLSFESYFASEISGSLSTLEDGQVLKQESHPIDGKITSAYPLRKVSASLDGNVYATWTGNGSSRELELRGTDVNKNLNFAKLAPGAHTLIISAEDSTGRGAVEVIRCAFQIEQLLETYTITLQTEPQTTLSVIQGQALGTLPTPQREGFRFEGWYTQAEGGEPVSDQTVPTQSITLYPRWAENTVTEPTTQPTEPTQPTTVPTESATEPQGTEPLEEQNTGGAGMPPWLIPVIVITAVMLLCGGFALYVWKQMNKPGLFIKEEEPEEESEEESEEEPEEE